MTGVVARAQLSQGRLPERPEGYDQAANEPQWQAGHDCLVVVNAAARSIASLSCSTSGSHGWPLSRQGSAPNEHRVRRGPSPRRCEFSLRRTRPAFPRGLRQRNCRRSASARREKRLLSLPRVADNGSCSSSVASSDHHSALRRRHKGLSGGSPGRRHWDRFLTGGEGSVGSRAGHVRQRGVLRVADGRVNGFLEGDHTCFRPTKLQ